MISQAGNQLTVQGFKRLCRNWVCWQIFYGSVGLPANIQLLMCFGLASTVNHWKSVKWGLSFCGFRREATYFLKKVCWLNFIVSVRRIVPTKAFEFDFAVRLVRNGHRTGFHWSFVWLCIRLLVMTYVRAYFGNFSGVFWCVVFVLQV